MSSGPERYLFALSELLSQAGHTVIPFSVHYDQNECSEWDTFFVDPIAGGNEVYFDEHTWTLRSLKKSFERTVYSLEVERALTRLITASTPQVALLLQYLRKMSPSVIVALKKAGIPIVARLSDYALLCPGLHMYRDNRYCDECLGRSVWPSVRHKCVRGCRSASALNAVATQWHRHRGYFDMIDAFVTPSEPLRERLIEGGFSEDKVFHIPTFVAVPDVPRVARANQIAYVGRFDKVKGIEVLLDAFSRMESRGRVDEVSLVICGDDDSSYAQEIRALARSLAIRNVEFLGFLSHAGVVRTLMESRLSVIPSVSLENMPNVLLESLACGTPVVASDVPSIRSVVAGAGVARLFAPGDAGELSEALEDLLLDSAELGRMGRRAARLATERYSAASHIDSLMRVLASVSPQLGKPQ